MCKTRRPTKAPRGAARLAAWAALVLILAGGPRASAQEWPRFRGPNGTGISAATTVPVKWTEKDYNWKVALPGVGHSSPVLWGQRVFLTCGDKKAATRTVLCLSAADGSALWRRDFASTTHHMHRDNSYASSTPALDKDRVYLTWTTTQEVTLLALDHQGRDLWRRDLGPFVSMHGSGHSPIVHDGLVVLGNDQKGKASLIAVDAASGKTRWQLDRTSGLTPASTPCVYDVPGQPPRLIFSSTAHGITAVDPKTGQVDWEVPKVFLDRCVGSPVFAPGVVIASYGYNVRGVRLVAVRPGSKDKSVPAEVIWDLKKSVPLVPTPILKDGLGYHWSDDGTVTCLEVATGKQVWQERLGAEFYGSPVWVAGRLYCISRKGEVFVLAGGAKFELLARMPLGEMSYATPAVAGGVMYLRTYSHLISVGGKR